MRVRVHDIDSNRFFASEVYAILNAGCFTRYLVLVPDENGGRFRLFDYLAKPDKDGRFPVNINDICPNQTEQWVVQNGASLLPVQCELRKYGEIRFDVFRGYPWVLAQTELMVAVLLGKEVPFCEAFTAERRVSSRIAGWNYVETQPEAEALLEQAHGFHDSVIRELSYISGNYGTEDGWLHLQNVRRVQVIFDSQWCPTLELVFEGVTAVNLRPPEDNYSGEIFSSTVRVRDEEVFFSDYGSKEEAPSDGVTWIRAFGLRWRFLPPLKQREDRS